MMLKHTDIGANNLGPDPGSAILSVTSGKLFKSWSLIHKLG